MPRRHRRLAGRKPKRRSLLAKALGDVIFRRRVKPSKKRVLDRPTKSALRELL